MREITIQGTFPDLNTYINKERSNLFGAAALKKKYTEKARIAAYQKEPILGKVDIDFEWHVTTRHDPDNIAFGKKFILDGFVKAGLLKNDNQKCIGKLSDIVVKDVNPYVIVRLKGEKE